MELVYRALWRDDRLNPEVSVMEIFDKWSGSSKVETLNASGDGQLQVVEMRSNSSEERRTTIRIISQREDRYVWVDVEDFSSNPDLIWMLDEQGLIQDLIDDSEANRGSPRRGEIRFQSRVQLAGLAAIELIPHQSRKAAVICVAHDPLRENDQKELAKLLARQFAGIALVVYLPPGDLGRFQNSIGKHLSLYPGEIRVYPPAAKGSRNVAAVP